METKRIAFAMSALKANTARHYLEQAGIKCFIIDKTDSSYAQIFGQIELYVAEEDAESAKKILDDLGVLDNE